MRVLLIRPNSSITAVTFPLGLGYIAGAARAAGHQVSLLDARLLRLNGRDAARRALEFAPEAVGITGIHPEKSGVTELAASLRASAPDLPLVLGGQIVATSGAELVRQQVVDYAVTGEGERAFVAWLSAWQGDRDWSQTRSLTWRAGDEILVNEPEPLITDLDGLVPAWDLIDPTRYWRTFGRTTQNMLSRSRRNASIFSSRGCPFGCLYCHNIFGRRFRPRSPAAVLAEIELLRHDYGVEEVEFVDDAFNIDLVRAKEIARGLARLQPRLHISFSNGLRADRMDDELIDLLKTAGTYRINYAVESGSERIQELMHKNLDLEKTRQVIARTADRGIFTLGYFMLGFPGETEAEMQQTIDFALSSRLHTAGFFYVTPFPGTELARQFPLGADQAPALDTHDYTRLAVNFSAVSDPRMQEIMRSAYRRFHFAPDRMWRTFQVVPKNLRTAWSVLVVGIMSLTDFRRF